MNYPLVLRALRKHVAISQKAADFFRDHRKGEAFEQSMEVLDEALMALNHVESEMHRPIPRNSK